MSVGKGGARHTPKPHIDPGLLLKEISKHSGLIQDLGSYEKISRSQACDPKGLWVCLPLLKGLVELSPICEIRGACLRQAMFQVLLGEPSLNSTKWNGSVWVGLKVERITILLSHMRRLLGQNEMQACASKLTGAEFLQLQEVVKMIQQKQQVAADPTLAEKEKGNPTLVEREKADPALAEREASHTPLPERPEDARKLKKEVSEATVDSEGFPLALQTPDKSQSPLVKGDGVDKGGNDATLQQPPSFKRRRKGSLATQPAATEEGKQRLKDALGIGKAKKAKTKARNHKASSSTKPLVKGKGSRKKKPLVKGAKPLVKGAAVRKPWAKLYVTQTAKPPWRAYITGTTDPKGKPKLVVETTKRNHPKYKEILQNIKQQLQEEHLTKEEALELRASLYKTHPC